MPQIYLGLLDYRKGCGPDPVKDKAAERCYTSLTGSGTQPKSASKQT